jgi:MinD superfamily P-loop ATPase
LSRCTYCGKCADICRFKAIAVIAETTVLTFDELCHSCGGCVAVCPEGAISEAGRELGYLETGGCGQIAFAQGCLRVGEAMAPPLIKRVRRTGADAEVTIIDAPPGTSCPVIAAMRDSDFVLLVTEPTPFGLHDLKLAAGAVKALGLKAGLIVNRSGLGDDGVDKYAKETGLPILMQIPFDRRIAEAYSRGEMIVEAIPDWKAEFARLHGRIVELAAPAGVES